MSLSLAISELQARRQSAFEVMSEVLIPKCSRPLMQAVTHNRSRSNRLLLLPSPRLRLQLHCLFFVISITSLSSLSRCVHDQLWFFVIPVTSFWLPPVPRCCRPLWPDASVRFWVASRIRVSTYSLAVTTYAGRHHRSGAHG